MARTPSEQQMWRRLEDVRNHLHQILPVPFSPELAKLWATKEAEAESAPRTLSRLDLFVVGYEGSKERFTEATQEGLAALVTQIREAQKPNPEKFAESPVTDKVLEVLGNVRTRARNQGWTRIEARHLLIEVMADPGEDLLRGMEMHGVRVEEVVRALGVRSTGCSRDWGSRASHSENAGRVASKQREPIKSYGHSITVIQTSPHAA